MGLEQADHAILPGALGELQARAVPSAGVAVARPRVRARGQQRGGQAQLELRGGLLRRGSPLGGGRNSQPVGGKDALLLRRRAEELERGLPRDVRLVGPGAVLGQQPDDLLAAPQADRGAEWQLEARLPERRLGRIRVCLEGEAHLLQAVLLQAQE